MPGLGADMTEGTLVLWMVKPGDSVKRGDIVAIIGTDKADIEAEIFETGVVEKLIAQPGDKLPVGAPLALIRGLGEAPIAEEAPAKERLRASPLARKLAKDLGVDLSKVKGTGLHGAIERHDVEEAAKTPAPVPPVVVPEAAAAPPSPPPAPTEAPGGMRRAIAAAMARSNREIPHYYLSTQVDMTHALHWLEEFNRNLSMVLRVLPAALLLKAVARALVEVPELNGFWTENQFQPSAGIHLGVAVSLRQGGLVIPAIHSADQKPLEELMESLREVITRARSGRLRSSDITDSTITVTNLGDLGVETVFGVIYPPQVALVGFGKIVERPWVEHGMIGVRPVLTATLAADHRATDGHTGARFLEILRGLLEAPERL